MRPMHAYVAAFQERHPSRPLPLDDGMMDVIRRMRGIIREEEGGGGMCHVVTEWLEGAYGVNRLPVTYLSKDREVAVAGHLVSYLDDGSILDPTADQFGEGHDIRLLRPEDTEYERYRPEFDRDFNPGMEEFAVMLGGWRAEWTGEEDCSAQDRLRGERGEGWWVDDPTLLLAYCREQHRLATGVSMMVDDPYHSFISHMLESLEERLVETRPVP